MELQAAANLLKGAVSIAALTGSGISAESGIPTFRGPSGLWRGKDPTSLATPDAFRKDPKLVWEFYNDRRALLPDRQPNPGHHALVQLAERTPRFTLITQNVDRLHTRAGSRDVLELHGNIWDVRCTSCGTTFDKTVVPLPPLPRCEQCDGLLRPAVVWFGESLPAGVWEAALSAVTTCDVFLVIGTSALVYPAAGLVGLAGDSGAKVIEINLEPAATAGVDIGLYGKSGEILPELVAHAFA